MLVYRVKHLPSGLFWKGGDVPYHQTHGMSKLSYEEIKSKVLKLKFSKLGEIWTKEQHANSALLLAKSSDWFILDILNECKIFKYELKEVRNFSITDITTTYDRLDQYYRLDENIPKDILLNFFEILFTENKIEEFKDLKKLQAWKIYATFKTDSESIIDVIGGCFGIMRYYIQGFYGNNFPKNCQGTSIQKAKMRFEWLKEEIKKNK